MMPRAGRPTRSVYARHGSPLQFVFGIVVWMRAFQRKARTDSFAGMKCRGRATGSPVQDINFSPLRFHYCGNSMMARAGRPTGSPVQDINFRPYESIFARIL